MTIRKSNPYLSLVNSYLIDSPQPSSINYWWNVGSLLGLCLVIQIASGIFLAMHYSSNIELAFNSVEHIMRDVNAGWLLRYIHANGASFFFICLYLHIGKALYYGSYKTPRVLVWSIGVIIFILVIATAFMGYTKSSPKSIKYNKIKINYPSHQIPGGYIIFKRNYNTNNKLNKNLNVRSLIKQNNDNSNINELFKEICIKPEIWWDNLHILSNKDIIRNEVKNKSGIYIIINKITKNYYIGSAHTNNLYNRFHNHLYTNNNKGSKLVQRAVFKYGINNFIYAILEFYPYEVNKYNNEELFALESSYIGLLLPQYNILTEAGQFFGYKNKEINLNNKLNLINLSLTDERKSLLKDIKKLHMDEFNKNRNNNLSIIAKNRSYSYWTKEGLNNISKGKSKIILLRLNLTDETPLCSFKNINSTSHYLCCSNKTIQRSLKLGFIHVPDLFIPLLNPLHIDNHNSIIEHIDKSKLYLYNYRNTTNNYNDFNKRIKLRCSLTNYKHFTKLYISSILSRYV